MTFGISVGLGVALLIMLVAVNVLIMGIVAKKGMRGLPPMYRLTGSDSRHRWRTISD